MTYQEWLESELIRDKVDRTMVEQMLAIGNSDGAVAYVFTCAFAIGKEQGISEMAQAAREIYSAGNAPLGTEPQS